MEENLISKKELLEATGISYGQLYRWKRKNLIPEEWFIRKSTFTGQETFFPRTKILARLDKILNMKDDLSLDELADVFSPGSGEMSLTRTELLERNIVTVSALDLLEEGGEPPELYPFDRILAAYVLNGLLLSGDISREEGRMLVQVLSDHAKWTEKDGELLLVRKLGVSGFILQVKPGEVYLDSGFRIVSRIRLSERMEELKITLG